MRGYFGRTQITLSGEMSAAAVYLGNCAGASRASTKRSYTYERENLVDSSTKDKLFARRYHTTPRY